MQLLELSEHEVECIPELVQLGDDTVLVLLLVGGLCFLDALAQEEDAAFKEVEEAVRIW